MKKVLVSVLSSCAILTNVFAANTFAACATGEELEKIGEWRMQMELQNEGTDSEGYRIADSTDTSSSENGYIWVGKGAQPSQTEGITPSAMTLEGTSGATFVDTTGSYIGGREEFSISEWVNVEQLPSGNDDTVELFGWEGALRVYLSGNNLIHVVTATDNVEWWKDSSHCYCSDPIEMNKWQHIGITYDQTNGLNLYINGVLKKTNSITGALKTPATSICIGSLSSGANAVKRSFDDITIYAKALTADQIRSIASVQPLLYLSGETTSDGKLVNKGFCDDITPSTGGTLSTENTGKLGKSISFEGTESTSYLATMAKADFATRVAYTNEMTFATWIKPRALTTSLLDENGVFHIQVTNDGKVAFRANTSNVKWYSKTVSSQNTITPNEWVHIAVTYDGSKTAIYINGVLDTKSSDITGNITLPSWDGSQTLNICMGAGGSEVDEFQMYGRALTAEEIKSLTKSASVNVKSLCGSTIDYAPCGSTVYAEATMNADPTNGANLFLAVYDKDGVLTDVIAKKYETPANTNPENPLKINSDLLDIPAGLTDDCGVVRAFLWDNNMTPLD